MKLSTDNLLTNIFVYKQQGQKREVSGERKKYKIRNLAAEFALYAKLQLSSLLFINKTSNRVFVFVFTYECNAHVNEMKIKM